MAAVDGQLTCKILDTKNRQLLSAHADFPLIAIDTDTMDLVVEGVVLHAIHHLRGRL